RGIAGREGARTRSQRSGHRARDCGVSFAVQRRTRLHAHEPQTARHTWSGHALWRNADLRGLWEEVAHRRASAGALSYFRESENSLRPARDLAGGWLTAAGP